MKTIKFRGKSKLSGEMIYGDFSHYKGGSYIQREDNFGHVSEVVAPDSVAQCVGFDKNGNEFYSDDKIRVDDTKIEIAGDFIKVNDIGKTFDNVELLEVHNEKTYCISR